MSFATNNVVGEFNKNSRGSGDGGQNIEFLGPQGCFFYPLPANRW